MPKEASGAPSPIHIFRPGRHTAMQGRTLSFSGEDLAATAGAYDPALHEAPLVIGHPQADAPAFGWVQGLTAGPEGLFAVPRQLEPAFAEAVEQGRYKKVSASFYAPDSPHNPVPGVYYLRHVGFLGAQPPAVKGLQPVQFADDGEGCVTVEFAENPGLASAVATQEATDEDSSKLLPKASNDATVAIRKQAEPANGYRLRRLADVFRSLREYIVEKDGAETADRVLPAWTVSDLQEEAAQAAANAADIPAFTEDHPKEEPMPQNPAPQAAAPAPAPENPLEPAFAEAREQAAKLAAQVAELKADARLTRARAVVERQVAAGRLTPGQSQGLAEFMAGLDDELNFEFAEASGQTASVTPLAWMTAFLEGLPRQVEFSEVSRDTHDRVDGLTPADAARAALEYQEEARSKGRIVSVTDALAAVRAGRKESN